MFASSKKPIKLPLKPSSDDVLRRIILIHQKLKTVASVENNKRVHELRQLEDDLSMSLAVPNVSPKLNGFKLQVLNKINSCLDEYLKIDSVANDDYAFNEFFEV